MDCDDRLTQTISLVLAITLVSLTSCNLPLVSSGKTACGIHPVLDLDSAVRKFIDVDQDTAVVWGAQYYSGIYNQHFLTSTREEFESFWVRHMPFLFFQKGRGLELLEDVKGFDEEVLIRSRGTRYITHFAEVKGFRGDECVPLAR